MSITQILFSLTISSAVVIFFVIISSDKLSSEREPWIYTGSGLYISRRGVQKSDGEKIIDFLGTPLGTKAMEEVIGLGGSPYIEEWEKEDMKVFVAYTQGAFDCQSKKIENEEAKEKLK